jgi:hypothetical protein
MWLRCGGGFKSYAAVMNSALSWKRTIVMIASMKVLFYGVRQELLYTDIRLHANQIGCFLACQNIELNP